MARLPVCPSWNRQVFNAVLCIACFTAIFLYFRRYVYLFPITCESIWQISLAEVNRRKNIRRIRLLEQKFDSTDEENGIKDKAQTAVRQIASVVGYREEPNLFRKCLQSYPGSPGLEIMLVGIDGDGDGDMEMVRIAEEVFADSLTKIHIREPFGPLAVRIAESYIEAQLQQVVDHDKVPKRLIEESHRYAFKVVTEKAINILREHGVLNILATGSLRAICLYQPHVCKKDIMFTNMIFSLVLGYANDIEFLWTSDSDTWVYPDTLYKVVGCMSTDPLIGGSCSSLSIHNGNESFVAALGSAAYWTELAITRGQTGAVDTVDCQPGPCAAFRLIALEPILLNWYTQTSIGIRTVVNEDRHLTTNLLLNGWKVTFNTQTLASTDTPTTLLRWLLQQIRWARATHIETFQYPQIYAIHGPILFVTAMRRFYGPLIIGLFTIRYVLTGYICHAYSVQDLFGRIILCTVYNYSVVKNNSNSIAMLVLSQIFYQLPLPGIMFWSVVTVFEGGWGTRMRNQSETQKGRKAGMENLWSTTAVVVWMGFVAAAIARLIASRIVPGLVLEMMLVSSAATVGSLFYLLLG